MRIAVKNNYSTIKAGDSVPKAGSGAREKAGPTRVGTLQINAIAPFP